MSKQPPYPRSLPFRPPENLTPLPPVLSSVPAAPAPPVQSQPVPPSSPAATRLHLFLLGYCSLFLVVGLALGYVFLRRSPQAVAATAPARPDRPVTPAPEAPPITRKPEPPPVVPDRIPARPVLPTPSEPDRTSPVPAPRPVAKASPRPVLPESALEVLGALTASQLYQSHLNIGLLADGVEAELYEKAEAGEMLRTVDGLLATVGAGLRRLPMEGLAQEDQKALAEVQRLAALLETQSRELQSYWANGEKEHVERFHKARDEAWTGINALVGSQTR
jgi:hypothetical protein